MDLDISNYSVQEMIDLLDLQAFNKQSIIKATEEQITKHEKNKEYATFFKEMQTYLLSSLEEKKQVDSVFQTEVKKGIINPDLKNTVTRFINIDSACRQNFAPENIYSDSYDFELTEPLTNVISMSMYSIEVPHAWYTNTTKKGTTSFLICQTEPDATVSSRDLLIIPEGNYTTLGLLDIFTKTIIDSNLLTNVTSTPSVTYELNPCTGRCRFFIHTSNIIQFIWYDDLKADKRMLENRINYNLGWMLGFRLPITFCVPDPLDPNLQIAQAISIVDASGTKYLVLVLDDYKPNRINRSIVSVNTNPKIKLQTPSYYNESVPQYRTSPNITDVHVLPSNPRTLTLKQIHTINSIQNQIQPNVRINSYVGSNSFAKVNIKKTEWNKYDGEISVIDNGPARLIVENGGPLQLQTREYFGPVDIMQMSVSLYDDKGHLLGLNGIDWSFTIMVKCIYQY